MKFDYIINDVSGISNKIAIKSPWFKKIVPCDTGLDGTKLSSEILEQSKKYLKKKGIIQIPLISLSNIPKTIALAKKNFKYVETKKTMILSCPSSLSSSSLSLSSSSHLSLYRLVVSVCVFLFHANKPKTTHVVITMHLAMTTRS